MPWCNGSSPFGLRQYGGPETLPRGNPEYGHFIIGYGFELTLVGTCWVGISIPRPKPNPTFRLDDLEESDEVEVD